LDETAIPKIIWQTHEWEYADLPKNFLATSMTWQNLNPGWQYRYVSGPARVNEIQQFDDLLYKLYFLADKTTQADIWRYVVLYKYGGVYADMDSICTTPLDYLIQNTRADCEILTTKLDVKGVANNSNFVVSKESTILRLILDNLLDKYKNIDIYKILSNYKPKPDIWNHLEEVIKTSPAEYSKVLMRNKSLVSFDFLGVEHSEDFKTEFTSDFHIDYYGTTETYSHLAMKNAWETYIEFKE
jgi:hypothetical protein